MKNYIIGLLLFAVVFAPGARGQENPPAGTPGPATPEIVVPPVLPDVAPAVPVTKTTIEPAVPPTTNAIVVSVAEVNLRGATSDAGRNLISVSLEKVALSEVIRMFARISGANIVVGTNGHELVTVSLQNVEWEPALRAILDSAGKVLILKSPGIYTIASKSEVAAEPLTVETIFLKYVTPTALVPSLEKMLIGTNTSVVAVPAANALMIKGLPANINEIRKVVALVDIPREQVFIEAKFVELNDQAIKDLGINWQSLQGVTLSATGMVASFTHSKNTQTSKTASQAQTDQRVHADGVNQFYDINNQPSASQTGPLNLSGSPTFSSQQSGGSSGSSGQQVPVISPGTVLNSGTGGRMVQDTIQQAKLNTLGVMDNTAVTGTEMLSAVLSASDFSATLSALKQNSGATIISNPRLLVASGQSATIHVGEDHPYAKKSTSQQGTGGASTQSEIDTIKTGVELLVVPTVNARNNITLKIQPKLSRVIGSTLIDGNAIPILSTRTVDSEFNIENDRTVAIGGLTSDTDSIQVNKIPFLGDIPIIGKYLFSHTHTEKVQDEVIIFVSVSVVKAEGIKGIEGIPSTGKLIHQQMLKEQAAAELERRQKIADEQKQKDKDKDKDKAAAGNQPAKSSSP